MFSTKERLRRRTPAAGIDREEYIEHLVEEFHTTTNVEAQEQVSANLANFAYDPVNYPFLKKSSCLELFIQTLSLPNDKLVLHGIAGICNLCLDEYFKSVILAPTNLAAITALLSKDNPEIVLQTLATLTLLTTPKTKEQICIPKVVRDIQRLRESKHIPIKRLASVFIEDNCTKTEIIQL